MQHSGFNHLSLQVNDKLIKCAYEYPTGMSAGAETMEVQVSIYDEEF